ncbi:MAG TPA: hypothetical protein VEB86_10810, partial [Chryseosolibacter sp.]|nr:hypothetical protein [Chryseosolibacter sp.]
MSLQLRMPYKVVAWKEKRYDKHYNIPSKDCVIVPVKLLADEALCDIRWEDTNGVLNVLHDRMFVAENLIPLNPIVDMKLYELWSHYYNGVSQDQPGSNYEQVP